MTEIRREDELYEPMRTWLGDLLRSRHPRTPIEVLDTSQRSLSRVIEERGWAKQFPGWETYDVHVDIAGFICRKNIWSISLVEVKLNAITLKDIGQLLGYCKVVQPELGVMLSPEGLSSAMSTLLNIYQRLDVLSYANNRSIILGKWIVEKTDLDYQSIIPRGANLVQ